ncbi:hypothetical protein M2302_004684 [Micromonospora sp. A200]|uniref:hypothetical protein n=1 Tax=Micromonospora sp. A200 TaxID=2940568 RepID=UPI00247395AE|nr:hypothetical protein [Micromonospora sp. A200]MDH6464485.1 hypothetical protein [Micromonospora sp. A200]
MIFRNRAAAFAAAGAAGVIAAGAFAAPAFAATSADLAIKASGTTIAVGAPGKNATVSLINKSDVDAKGILVGLDISKLDTKLVDIDESGCNRREDGIILCGIEGDTIPAGADIDWAFPLSRTLEGLPGDGGGEGGTGTGPAGSITAFILHEGEDPDESNNEVTVDVKVEGTGPDLAVFAPDVDQAATVVNGNIKFSGALNPGGKSGVYYRIENHGDAAAAGLKISVKLPKGVTFTEAEEDCEYNASKTSLVCNYENFGLIPAKDDTNANDKVFSGYGFFNLITVGENVKSGSLTGGTVTVESLAAATTPSIAKEAAPALPKNIAGVQAKDVDATDNSDDFAVVVAKTTGGGGGGGLPVTGPQAGLIGGIGVAVLAAGGAMFVMARRRRVVLVIPGDEKPTA